MQIVEEQYTLLAEHLADFLEARCVLSMQDRSYLRSIVIQLCAAMDQGNSCLQLSSEEAGFLGTLNPLKLISEGGMTPLILWNSRLYLHRYFHYEKRLATQLGQLARAAPDQVNKIKVFKKLFADTLQDDLQFSAVVHAQNHNLTIVCGGPGTGKTTTVLKMLAGLLAEAPAGLQIGLAAPTGKAAMRLSESLQKGLAFLKLPENIRAVMPFHAQTIHRLLGTRRNRAQFIYGRDKPMVWDVLVVDEASMVDLVLMSKLVDALKPGARLLLLGDKDQLASVESGAVLTDLISALPANSVQLQTTYRFDENIKMLAEYINGGKGRKGWSLLENSDFANIQILQQDVLSFIGERYLSYMKVVHQRGKKALCFAALQAFTVLCAVHFGSRGIKEINRGVEKILTRAGYLCRENQWYQGRPVMVTRNDYGLELFNGDIGICLIEETGETRVWFPRENGRFISHSPHSLPSCETVFAMTVHKSQGSEFEEVVVALPEQDYQILSRELLYTAISRAKARVYVAGSEDIFIAAASRRIHRTSGLATMIALDLENGGEDAETTLLTRRIGER